MILPCPVPDLILITAEHDQVRPPKCIPALLRLSTYRQIPRMPHLGHPPNLQLPRNRSSSKSNNMHSPPPLVKAMPPHSPLVPSHPGTQMVEYSEHAYMTFFGILLCRLLYQICQLVISPHPLPIGKPQVVVFLPILHLVLIHQTLTRLHYHHHHPHLLIRLYLSYLRRRGRVNPFLGLRRFAISPHGKVSLAQAQRPRS